ncbi:ABC transporter ATP-binding protein [Actibacterium sp. 188UL27-1]|uniref:ABC transporter ATP-binding protein n=1 Tax=Actibacterium sp. 188UL27-1 TaxID=2786961 RepID=UPI00195A706F|nr:ATP-binding cassette domain-containing protein [Actibacterium sp. 188UL27-1]MBM7066406.1 ABC transporter ATP-binding protein [Actibacterium sp. 188UL27-1]
MTVLRLAEDSDDGAGAGRPAQPVLRLDLRSLRLGKRDVLGPISLEVRPAETVVLTGPSGIGKTSLLRVVAGLQTQFDGVCQAPDRLSMVFQEPTLLPWRSALNNLTLTTGISASTAVLALNDVGLADHADAYPGALSLGQQRRLALARAFAGAPDLLLMDEPFVSLDPDLVEEMMALFARLRAARQVATLMVTHSADEAKMLASRIVELGGSPARIMSDRQNNGAYFQLSASGVTSSKS